MTVLLATFAVMPTRSVDIHDFFGRALDVKVVDTRPAAGHDSSEAAEPIS